MSDLIGMDDNFLRDSKKYLSLKKDAVNTQMLELDEEELYQDELHKIYLDNQKNRKHSSEARAREVDE